MQQDGKIDFVREGLGYLIEGLKDEDRFAIVTYETDVVVPFPMQDVKLHRTEARAVAEALVAGGGTNLHAGLLKGYEEVEAVYDSGRQNRVILLSDGLPTVGLTDTPAILTMSKAHNSDGVGLTTIGLGTSFNAELMRDLALQADGNFYFLESSAAVSEVFQEELSYFTVPVAYDLVLDVQVGQEYSFGAAHGSPLWTDTSYGGRIEVPSVFLAHRQSHDDVTDGGGRRGGGSALLIEVMPKLSSDDGSGITHAAVATVDVQFREPGSNEIITDSVIVDYPLPPWITQPAGFFDGDLAIVHKSFVMLNSYVGIENACTEFHAGGEVTETVAELDWLIAAVQDYNDGLEGGQGDTDITADIELLRDLRQVLLENGVEPPPDPELPQDPWPCD
jgi:Ca-activated chloride channel family protein